MGIDTVNDLARRVLYTASAAQVDFDYPFPIFTDADLVVYVDDILQGLNVDYTVTGETEDVGGVVTFATPLAGGEIVTIYSELAIERTTDYQTNGPFTSVRLNDELDRLVLICRELKDRIGRCIRWPFTASQTSDGLELSPIAAWYGKFLRVSDVGNLEPAELVSNVVALTPSVVGELLYPQTPEEVAAGVTPVDFTFPVGTAGRYGVVGDGVADDTNPHDDMLAVGGQGVWLDYGSNLTILRSPFTMNAANQNVPPSWSGDNLTIRAKAGSSGVLCTLENPHSTWPMFGWTGDITFDANGLCTSAFLLHGAQRCNFGAARFIKAVGGPQCRIEAEANFGVQNNKGGPWIAGGQQADGGNDDGFSIKSTDGSNRIAANEWSSFKSSWNEGAGFDIDRCSDIFVNPEAEKNDLDGFLVDNTTSLTIVGGYSEHNNQSFSGDDTTDGTTDVSMTLTANSFRVHVYGGRHIGAFAGISLGSGHVILPGQNGGTSITQLGVGFGGATPVDNGLGFLNSADILIRASGATKASWNFTLDRMRSHVNHELLKALIHNVETVTYSASMTPDAGAGDEHIITATNGTAFTINAPSNPVTGMVHRYTIRNSAGGALGAATWNAVFKMSTWTNPANGFSRSIEFRYNGSNWVQTTQTGVDVPN